MSIYNIELKTKSELKIGERLLIEIVEMKNISASEFGEKSSTKVCVVNQLGRRTRALGYVNPTSNQGYVVSDDLIKAMDENGLEKIEVEVLKKDDSKSGERNLYLLKINSEDVLSSLMKNNKNVLDTVESVMDDVVKITDNHCFLDDEVVLKDSTDNSKGAKFEGLSESDLKEITLYLASNDIPEKYITKIIKSYKTYPKRYFERVPNLRDEGFTPWKYGGVGENLLKLAIISIEMGKNLRFVGGKGAGKNTLLNTLAWVYQRPLFSQSANRDTDITHLFGDKTINIVDIDGQIAQTIEFEKGLLVEAMEIGGFYEFGEGNACRPEVTMALHSVLDSRREADVNGYKLVKADKNFSFVLTMNVDYEGCNSLNQAFRDRFVTISFENPTTIVKLLRQACPTAKDKDIEICNKLYTYMLSRASELQTDEMVTIRGYINALDLAQDLGLKTSLKMCVAYNVSDDEIIVNDILESIDNLLL